MSKSIYDEAIADAKKIREVAEKNAKDAILEAVTPRIRDFIEQTILEQTLNEEEAAEEEEAEEEAEEAEEAEEEKKTSSEETQKVEETVTLDESAITSLLSLLGGDDALKALDKNQTRVTMESAVQAALMRLSPEEQSKIFEIADKIDRNADILESNVINNDISLKENIAMAKETFYEVDLKTLQEAVNNTEALDESSEITDNDLKEIMGLLEQELPPDFLTGGEEVEAEEEVEPGPEGEEVEEEEVEVEETELPPEIEAAIDELEAAIAAVVGGAEEDLEAAGEAIAAGEEDLEGGEEVVAAAEEEVMAETYEIDPKMLQRELRRIRRQIREGKGDDSSWGGKGSANAGTKNSYGGKGTGKIGAKRSFGGGTEGKDAFVNPPQLNKLSEALKSQVRLNRDLNEKLTKYRGAVKTLREQLEDLNLFNAKLLYVNKLLQNKSLTESQRKSVIRALDKASSLNEAKTLYKSLTESFAGTTNKTLSESRHRGSSSRPTTSAASKTDSGEVGRWAKLAGLK